MDFLKSHRALITNMVMMAFALIGVEVRPEMATEYADAMILLFGLVNIVLHAFQKKQAGGSDDATLKSLMTPFLVATLLAGTLSACATPVAETPAQKVFALKSDFHAMQPAALALVSAKETPNSVKLAVRLAENTAYDALTGAEEAARAGDNPAFSAAFATATSAVSSFIKLLQKGAL
jgi:hypothetical protein